MRTPLLAVCLLALATARAAAQEQAGEEAPALSRTPLVLLAPVGEREPNPPGVVATLTKPVREMRLAECVAGVAGRRISRVTPLVSDGSSARRSPRAAESSPR